MYTCVCVRVCVRALPEETYADPTALSESTKAKPLLAVDVSEHKGKILAHLTLVNSANRYENTLTLADHIRD